MKAILMTPPCPRCRYLRKTLRISGAVAAAFTLVTACTVGPDYTRAPLAQPAQYRVATGDPHANADIAWWDSLNDPSLSALVDEAMHNNYDVRIASARLEQFRGQLETARAGLFPQVGASFGAARQRTGTFSQIPALQSLDGPNNSFQALGTVSWEIDLWGKTRRMTEAARADLLGSEYARRGVILGLAAAVVEGYVNLLGLDAQLEIAQHTLAQRGQALDIIQQRYAGGVVSEMELSQSQDAYYATEAAIPPIVSAIGQTENALSVLTGRPPGPIVRGRTITELAIPEIPADLPSSLLARRPDVLQAEQNAVAANAGIGAAEALWLPNIGLTASGGQISSSTASLWNKAAQVWGLSASVTQPLFEGGAIHGQVRQAKSLSEQTVFTYQETVLSALADVNDALLNEQQTRLQLDSVAHQVDSLQTYLLQAQRRYEAGYSSYLEVTTAEDKLLSSQLQQTQSETNRLTGIIQIYLALGGGWTAVPADIRADQLAHKP